MKLLLTSYRIPDPAVLVDLLQKPVAECKIALVLNAKDEFIDRVRSLKFDRRLEYFESLGFVDIGEIDLRADSGSVLVKKLGQLDAIWLAGGNTFLLMEAIEKSGFSDALHQIDGSKLLFIGESAGAVVAGTTLRTTEYADEPEYAEQVFWDGLRIVDSAIVPHADNDFYSASVDAARELFKDDQVIFLDDNQMLLVDGDSQEILTVEQEQSPL